MYNARLRQGVRRRVLGTFLVVDGESKAKQLGKGPLLPRCGEALLCQVDQTALVGVDRELSVLEVRAPLIHRDGHRQVLFFVCGEALIAWAECLAHICDRVAVLLEHGADSLVAGVGLDGKQLGEVREGQHRSLDELAFEHVEGRLRYGRPDEWHPFLKQVEQRAGQDAEVFDETPVVAGELQEAADSLDVLGDRPLRLGSWPAPWRRPAC